MISNRIPTAAALAASIGLAGCSREPARSPGSDVERPAETRITAALARPPFVQAGTELTLTILDPVGTSSRVGTTVRARVDEDLSASDGRLVVPRGSLVEGKVARADAEPVPVLALDFIRVSTPHGPAPLSAKLHRAERIAIGDDGEIYEPMSSPYDALFTAAYPPGPSGYAAPGASVYYHDHYDEDAGAIQLPKGARLHLELSAPLVPDVSAR